MQTHELKTLAPYWDAVSRGDKMFEVRRDDRGFQKGDLVKLHRMRPGAPAHYDTDPGTGQRRTITMRINYVLTGGQFGIQPGFVVLGLTDTPET